MALSILYNKVLSTILSFLNPSIIMLFSLWKYFLFSLHFNNKLQIDNHFLPRFLLPNKDSIFMVSYINPWKSEKGKKIKKNSIFLIIYQHIRWEENCQTEYALKFQYKHYWENHRHQSSTAVAHLLKLKPEMLRITN